MKKNLYHSIYILAIMIFFTSCENNKFEIISNENKLIKNDEISRLKITEQIIEYYTNKHYSGAIDGSANYLESKKRIDEIFHEKLKGIQSKIRIQNNSNQIIEKGNLTIRIKYIFENDKEFNYIKPYNLLPNNKIWKKNKTLELNINNVINFSIGDETKILKIHTPKKVTIEYYLTAKNSIGYNNLDKTEETINTNFYNFNGTYDARTNAKTTEFGLFTSAALKENEILGFGDKILSEDITDLWNENIRNDTLNQKKENPNNGDLNDTFKKQEQFKKQTEEKYLKEKEKLIIEGWKEEEIQNGQFLSCYNFKPIRGNIKNSLEVSVGGGTDVSIKIMNIETEKCTRYVFINSGTTYSIDNIPEGEYYLKIAYGKNWLSKIENGQCIGKFIKNPMYEKGDDILNFNIQRDSKGRNIPSYQLSLDVVSNGVSNSFNSQNISESDFNK